MRERKALDAKAFALMLGLTALWGFQQVAIKLTAPDISLVMQAGLRSVIATALLLAWAQWRGTPLFGRDGTLGAGIVAGLLFGGEFIFIYGGLEHTAASRMVVFIYLAPVLTALGCTGWCRARSWHGRSGRECWSLSPASRSPSATGSRRRAARCWGMCSG